jgi:hypothetical protein
VSTPEAKVKKMVQKVLDEFEPLYRYWPVPSGFGASSLDCIVCYNGYFIGIETKAPGKEPTPRQELCIKQMQDAGGHVFIIDSEQECEWLRSCLKVLSNANDR